MDESLNVFDEPLESCGTDPMTGFFRDGCCNTNDDDVNVLEVEHLIKSLKADKKEFESKQFSDYKDQFQWFVGFGLLLLVLDVFLLDKKTKWVQKLNLFNER